MLSDYTLRTLFYDWIFIINNRNLLLLSTYISNLTHDTYPVKWLKGNKWNLVIRKCLRTWLHLCPIIVPWQEGQLRKTVHARENLKEWQNWVESSNSFIDTSSLSPSCLASVNPYFLALTFKCLPSYPSFTPLRHSRLSPFPPPASAPDASLTPSFICHSP